MTSNLLASIAPPKKTKSQRLSDLLPAIEGARAVGHSHAAIHEYVKNTIGLDLTLRYYHLILHRLRRRSLEETSKPSVRPTPVAPVRVPAGGVVEAGLTIEPADENKAAGERFTYDVKASINEFFS